ncbi:MAG: YdeI/OmpD-associated family protein, partial [Flavobacteriaceae bacterium]
VVLAYMNESLLNSKKGLELAPTKKSAKKTEVPELLKSALSEHEKASQAFTALTPYKQKEYSEYIADAKQEKTKLARLEKIFPMILKGVGLNDKYKKC